MSETLHRFEADVVVVGAGLAGLAAAKRLRQLGASVILLEARRRVGGRVHGVGEPQSGLTVELGGELVGPAHTHLRRLCMQLGTDFVQNPPMASLVPDHVVLGGRTLSSCDVRRLRQELDGVIAELSSMEFSMRSLLGSPLSSSTLGAFARQSVDEWLCARRTSSRLRAVFSDLPRTSQSLLALLCLMSGAGGGRFFAENEAWHIRGGASSVVRRLVKELKEHVRLGCAVKRVEEDARGTSVFFKANGVTESARGHVAVVAVPAPCWPSQPAHTRLRLPRLLMATNYKLSLVIRSTAAARLHAHANVLTDRAWRLVDVEFLTNRAAMVRAFVCPHLPGSHAVVDGAIRTVAMSRSTVVACLSEQWHRSRWSRGAYPTMPPGRPDTGWTLPSGRVIAAGDWTDPHFLGYMEGAVRSGERAANEAMRWL